MPTTFLDLPTEIRLKIYQHVFHGIAIRPHRKLGWNRPSGDLSTPALLFANHSTLAALFASRLFKHDATTVITALVSSARILVLDHADFAALRRLENLRPTLAVQTKANIRAARSHIRTIDFADKFDDVLCQPSDVAKLLKSLTGVRTVRLTSCHSQRYANTIDQELKVLQGQVDTGNPHAPILTFTDGTRLLRAFSPQGRLGKGTVVDLSMLVWQHFFYAGAPYRDEWRVAKMQSLLKAADNKLEVIFSFRNIFFVPDEDAHETHTGRTSASCKQHWWCVFRAEMSTRDWLLRLGHRGGLDTYTIPQRKEWNQPVSQEGYGRPRKNSL